MNYVDLNGLRQQAQILGHEHDTAKRRYDGIMSSVDSSLSSIVRVNIYIYNRFDAIYFILM